jgi:hypothetical protein
LGQNNLAPGERDPQSIVVPVTPLLKGRAIPMLPRVLLVTVLVGVAAFVAGAQLGGHQAAEPASAVATATPTLADTPVPSAAILGTVGSPVVSGAQSKTAPLPVVRSGASTFARSFQPALVIAEVSGSAACVSSVLGPAQSTTVASRQTLARSWVTSCPIAANRRVAFITGLMRRLVIAMPTSVSGTTRGYKGMTLLYYLYSTETHDGTVVMTFKDAGKNLIITTSLEEGTAGA